LTVRLPGKGPSIYDHVLAHLDLDGALTPEDTSLPDEDQVMSDEIKRAPGAMEGVFGHHGGAEADAQDRENVAAEQLSAAARRPATRNLERL
jgi:hypothetical protein